MKTAKHTLLKRTLALTAGVALAASLQVVNTSAVAAEFTYADYGNIVDVLGKGADGGQYLRDKHGNQIFLRGLNTQGTAKIAPDCMPSYSPEEISRERDELKSNSVRLLMQWRCVEPEQGQYDYDYLDRIGDLVDLYNSNGMTVLLDMHQDLYGPGITESRDVGNGAPVWATYTDGLPVREQPDWSLYYLQPGVIRAFDNFWNKRGNHPELMESYAKMWQIVAGRFSQHPGVFGYDLMNEPFSGSYLPNVLESGALAKLYAMTIERIREVDNDTWIHYDVDNDKHPFALASTA